MIIFNILGLVLALGIFVVFVAVGKILWTISEQRLVMVNANLENIRLALLTQAKPVPPMPGGRVKLKVKNPEDVDNGLDDWIP